MRIDCQSRPLPDNEPPQVWVLTDDKAGHSTQSFGLADALGWPWERKDLHFNARAARSNRRLGATVTSVDRERSSPLLEPWPDLVIATGRRTAPVARWIGAQSQGRTRLVQLGRKGGNTADGFDLTVTCTHFRQPRHPRREEVLAPITAITPAGLAEAATRWADLFRGGPRPWVALLVGGRSASHDIDAGTARRMAQETDRAVREAGGSLFVVTSPRTADAATAALVEGLGDRDAVYRWKRNDPDNPYTASLAVADVLIVTGDSESMIAEALAAGKPTYIFETPKRRGHAFKPRNLIRAWVQGRMSWKRSAAEQDTALGRWCAGLIERGWVQPLRNLDEMHASLYAAGLARPFGEPIATGWNQPWTETERVADRVRGLLGLAPRAGQSCPT